MAAAERPVAEGMLDAIRARRGGDQPGSGSGDALDPNQTRVPNNRIRISPTLTLLLGGAAAKPDVGGDGVSGGCAGEAAFEGAGEE